MRQPEHPFGHLSDHAGRHWLTLYCDACRRGSEMIDPADLIDAHGNRSMRSVVAGAVCKECGHRGASLRISPSTMRDGSDRPRQIHGAIPGNIASASPVVVQSATNR